jgi:hypothetical protein
MSAILAFLIGWTSATLTLTAFLGFSSREDQVWNRMAKHVRLKYGVEIKDRQDRPF